MTTEEKLKEMLGDYYEMGVPGSPNAAILEYIAACDHPEIFEGEEEQIDE